MKTTLNSVTLGVKDIAKSRKFYEQGLGWKASSMSNENFVAIQLKGIVLCLYPETALAEDAQTLFKPLNSFRGITLSHTVTSKAEVDTVLKEAVKAGAKLQKPAQDVFWGGYSAYFTDPDGHYWEVAWNPHWPMDENGVLRIP